jgi:hypothetical protein
MEIGMFNRVLTTLYGKDAVDYARGVTDPLYVRNENGNWQKIDADSPEIAKILADDPERLMCEVIDD